MDKRYLPNPAHTQSLTTPELRREFLVEGLFKPNELTLTYCDADRAIVGSAVPGQVALTPNGSEALACEYFTERREVGVLNIGATGWITVDGDRFTMENLDVLYIGRDSKEILFESQDLAKPAQYYLVSYPAHKVIPCQHIKRAAAKTITLGSPENANQRTIVQYIHPEGAQSCQLVMGFSELAAGSVWNTMPAHTHDRRTEIYMYFDFDQEQRVFHYMGKPEETRHILVSNGQAVISPSWSIHAGVGTTNYRFAWSMGGENQRFDDMDFIAIKDLQ